jgi:transcriptional regulator GlxA family with amidase domain
MEDLRETHQIGATTREWIVGMDTCQPMATHHLIWLRMRRTASLLTGSERRSEAFAPALGNESAVAFSTAYKQHMKHTPSAYRRNG